MDTPIKRGWSWFNNKVFSYLSLFLNENLYSGSTEQNALSTLFPCLCNITSMKATKEDIWDILKMLYTTTTNNTPPPRPGMTAVIAVIIQWATRRVVSHVCTTYISSTHTCCEIYRVYHIPLYFRITGEI